MLNQLTIMSQYNKWATERIYCALAVLPYSEVVKERPTLFKSIIHTLNHIYVIDDIFKSHLQGTQHPYTARNTQDYPTLKILYENQINMNEWYIKTALSLNEQEKIEEITFDFIDGGTGIMTRESIIYHSTNHATYHRGFIADMMYQIPTQPPVTDLPVFLKHFHTSL